jgi:hypothetical protein
MRAHVINVIEQTRHLSYKNIGLVGPQKPPPLQAFMEAGRPICPARILAQAFFCTGQRCFCVVGFEAEYVTMGTIRAAGRDKPDYFFPRFHRVFG